jgi:branched-chain amino acid transport system ATP-binding protein
MIETTGSIEFRGASIQGAEAPDIVRKGIAHVPQGRGTLPELSVEDNLRVGAYIRKDNEIDQDIDRWFDVYPVLRERRNQRAGSLSGGEQQMLAVSRALMSRPQMLLLDEPSLGLAPIIVKDLFHTLVQLKEASGVTVLLVEQNANLALEIADHAYVLEAGEIVVGGPASQIQADEGVRRAYLGY